MKRDVEKHSLSSVVSHVQLLVTIDHKVQPVLSDEYGLWLVSSAYYQSIVNMYGLYNSTWRLRSSILLP